MSQRFNHSSGVTDLPSLPSHPSENESSQRWNIPKLAAVAESTSESKNQVNLVKLQTASPIITPGFLNKGLEHRLEDSRCQILIGYAIIRLRANVSKLSATSNHSCNLLSGQQLATTVGSSTEAR